VERASELGEATMNYHVIKAFDDAMNELTKREQEEYDRINEEKEHMWMQTLNDDAEAIRDFLELVR
jgi:hypothetical protein